MSSEIHNLQLESLLDNPVQADHIIIDPPYGKTQNKWDKVIPFETLWAIINKCAKPTSNIIIFGMEPFASRLRLSNLKDYRYDIIWEKTRPVGFLNAYCQPLRAHESISIFYRKKTTYNVVKADGERYIRKSPKDASVKMSNCYRPFVEQRDRDMEGRFPTSVLRISNFNGCKFGFSEDRTVHQTQKPVALMELLIQMYTNPGETVLDFCMGSGTTGVACKRQGRSFIGLEKDAEFFELAQKRISEAMEIDA